MDLGRCLERQLNLGVESVTRSILGKGEYHRQFLKMFKMQMELRQADFDRLGLFFQARFLSYFFYSFVNKVLVQFFYGDFWPVVEIFDVSANVRGM